MNRKINVQMCIKEADTTSLRIACEMARKGQFNLEQMDKYGNTPLLQACYMGRYDCALTLLEFGANIYAINYYGQNALTLATYFGHQQLVIELLRRRSYEDFNLSSIIPAICVATMRRHDNLVGYFKGLDPGGYDVKTVHGLGVDDISDMVKKSGLDKSK